MKKYLISLSVFVIAIVALIMLLSGSHDEFQKTLTWYILAYFIFITVVSHLGLESTTKKRPQVFVRYYMASTSIRLLAHLVVIVSFAALNQGNARFFIIVFMIMYFLFTIFEVIYVMKNRA